MSHLTIGADPELFLRKGKRLISSIGRIGGTKHFPKPLGKHDGFYVQEDNVAVEFNIPPADTVESFVNSISYAQDEIKELVTKLGLEIHVVASAKFGDAQLRDPRAQEFGCDPDYNAWNDGLANPSPGKTNRKGGKRLRVAGGHVHLGYPENESFPLKLRIIQACDLFLGVPAVLLDDDTKRRQLYGQAGAFRETPYGVEYRTLSNFWLRAVPYMEWVFTNTTRAYEFAKSPSNWVMLDLLKDHIVRTVNDCDRVRANLLIEEYQIPTVAKCI